MVENFQPCSGADGPKIVCMRTMLLLATSKTLRMSGRGGGGLIAVAPDECPASSDIVSRRYFQNIIPVTPLT